MPRSGPPRTKTDTPSPLKRLLSNKKARLYIDRADQYLEAIGYTEHGLRHCEIVSNSGRRILQELSLPERDCELVAVAGLLHDIGNILGRTGHNRTGALLAKEILEELDLETEDILCVMTAIVMHEEDEGGLSDPISAALLIADKSDVHRSRVRNLSMISEDIHDRVNYAATEANVSVDVDRKVITLSLVIDTRISQVIEYFEIFLTRMAGCRRAARVLDCEFQLLINNTRMA